MFCLTIPGFVATNTDGKCPHILLKISGFQLQNVLTSQQKYLVLLPQRQLENVS